MIRLRSIPALLLVPLTLSHAELAPPGWDSLTSIDALPLLREGVRAYQVSSFDRTGGNDDRNTWLGFAEDGEYIIFDDVGPGCVYRMWFTGSQETFVTNRLRAYFDGETNPRLDMSLEDLFAGTTPPFSTPFVGNKDASSGGLYCYVPLPYRERCRITMTGFPPESERYQHWPADWGYYQITYHHLESMQGITSWTGTEDMSEAVRQWSAVGEDPKSTNDNAVLFGSISIPPGSSRILAESPGPGRITSIGIDPEPHDQATLRATRLLATWDHHPAPDIDCPLGDFFGSGFGETNVASLMVGMRTNGFYYCYFPMPFWETAHLAVTNGSGTTTVSLDYRIAYATNAPPRTAVGYFAAAYSEHAMPGDGSDYVMLDETGRGHVVGVNLRMQAGDAVVYGSGLAFLEVDERIFIDGRGDAVIHGTGTEDYFNCGWYFEGGGVNLPIHGVPVWQLPPGQPYNYAQAYRLHVGDVLPFYSAIQLGFEVIPQRMPNDEWAGVVYYYRAPSRAPGIQLSTLIDLGNSASESASGYTIEGTPASLTNTWLYAGDDDWTPLTDEGYGLTNSASFFAAFPSTNCGILVRRRTALGSVAQCAEVYVDDEHVGTWRTPDQSFTNSSFCWCDSEFMIPRGFTAGKTGVAVRVEPVAGPSCLWKEFFYWLYTCVPTSNPFDTDRDGMDDTWEVRYFARTGVADGRGDSDDDGTTDHDEFVADTNPTNDTDWFRITTVSASSNTAVGFDGSSNRYYTLEFSTNLPTEHWVEASQQTNVPGAGGPTTLTDPEEPSGNRFYRVRVAVPEPGH